ncbi:MAG TPA: ribosome biogenesis GTP-binding protein YihA/YsxC [Bryobacteraceae bacterium]|nr:ribosome biogenesis GTP-binding protein YihA/YsxC [Bryobacteraceae bacterium]
MMAAEFIIGAAKPELFPAESLPEIAFLGRSNVGKSSLINALVENKGLARTSATPGCTQAIQFYRVADKWHFVDLPGYGYAKVSHQQARGWKELIDNYLTTRESLQLCILLLDARRGWMEMDMQLKRWLDEAGRPWMAVATKIDKLKNQRDRAQSKVALQEGNPGQAPLAFSAETGQGVREIWQAISKIRKNP